MRIFVIIVSTILLLSFDLFSKYIFGGLYQSWIFDCFPVFPDCAYRYIPIWRDILGIQLSYNHGIAFSLPIRGVPLQGITVAILAGLGYYYIREEYPKKSHLLDAGYTPIFAGALSHAYERIFIGHVVDFISVKYFAILNFADIFISIGAFLLFIYYVRYDRKHR